MAQQYVQRYPEGYINHPSYIGGLRGSARTLPHYPSPFIEPTLGPILETNRGYPFTYLRPVVKSYKPGMVHQSVFVNGKAVAPGRFKAQRIADINAQGCS